MNKWELAVAHPQGGYSSTMSRSNWNLEMLVFEERGVPGENPLGARTRTKNKLNPHLTPSPELEPGPQWWEASALTAAPYLLLYIGYIQNYPPN